MHILVTGGAGYIGSHIIKQLLSFNTEKITVVDSLCGGTFDSISVLKKIFGSQLELDFINLDISNIFNVDDLFKLNSFDAVIHLAAHLQVGESINNPIK